MKTPDGVTIRAQEWGDPAGREVVFVHGFMQSHLSWQKQFTSPLLKDFRIVTYDFRGHGMSDKIMDPALYNDGGRFADELAAVLDAAQLKRPVIVGWSYGSRITTDYVMKYGTKRIAGINYTGIAISADKKYLGSKFPLISQTFSDDLAANVKGTRDFLRACFSHQPAAAEFEEMLVFNALVPVPIRGWLRRRAPYEETLKTVDVPVLISHGSEDAVLNLDMARYAASMIPGARLSVYEGMGHSPFWEGSERFNGELAAFIRDTTKP